MHRKFLILVVLFFAFAVTAFGQLNPQPAPSPTPAPRYVTVVSSLDVTQVVPVSDSDFTGTWPFFKLAKEIATVPFTAKEDGHYRVSVSLDPNKLLPVEGGLFAPIQWNCQAVAEYFPPDFERTFTDEPSWSDSSGAPPNGHPTHVAPDFSVILDSSFHTSYISSTTNDGFSASVLFPVKLVAGQSVTLHIWLYNPSNAKCLPIQDTGVWKYNYTFLVEKL